MELATSADREADEKQQFLDDSVKKNEKKYGHAGMYVLTVCLSERFEQAVSPHTHSGHFEKFIPSGLSSAFACGNGRII